MRPRAHVRVAVGFALLAALFAAASLDRAPQWLPLVYLGLGVISFLNYWRDKRAAVSGEWRVSEAALLGLDVVGGIVGGLFAQQLLRHKTQKPDFVRATWMIATLHAAALLLLGAFGLDAIGAFVDRLQEVATSL